MVVLLAYVAYGTVVFDGGTYTGGVLLITDGNAVLKSGTFQKGTNDYSIKTEDSGKHLSDYLDDDSQFWNDNTPLNLSNETQTADEVTVRPCKHKWENGKCTVCQKVCDHGSADGKSMTEDPCPTCGMKAEAQVDITGSDAKYFPSFNDALVYAFKNDGCTLKLLADVTGTTVMINNPFIFDLNGHNVDALSVDAKATIKDSGTTKGRIGKVTVYNEKVTDLTLGGLLEEGYAFKYGNGYWANDSYLQTTEGSFVTVEKAPIQSVNVYAKDKNNQEILTIAYGATGEVTLVASCKLSETSGAKLSCAWYKLTDDTAIPPLDGATGTSYTLPADLPAGKHTYWVTFTSDGYSKSAEITVTVTSVSLEDAEVTVQNPTYNGKEQSPTVTVKLGDKTLSRDNDYSVQVTKQTDAGSYKLTIKGGGNYSGTIEKDWKIEPIKIDHVEVSSDISKTYDGTAAVTKTAEEWATALTFKTRSASGVVDVPSSAYTISDVCFVTKNAAGEYVASPEVGEKNIQFTVTFKNNNYVLQTALDNQPASSKTYNQSGLADFTITQATVTSPGEITQLVFNDLAKTYTIDLAKLLPKLSEGCAYGSIQYQGHNYNFTDNAYIDGNDAVSVSKEGVLTLSTVAASTAKVGDQIGTITVPVVTTNYQQFELTIKVVIGEKITPVKSADFKISATGITYRQTLENSRLTVEGTMKDPTTGAEVKGTFAWENKYDLPINTGDVYFDWTFTPAEGYEEYAAVTDIVKVPVAPKSINGATITLEKYEFQYNAAEQSPKITGVTLDNWDETRITYVIKSGDKATDVSDRITLTIEGTGNYTGKATVEWKITPREVTPTIEVASCTYTGDALEPTVTVKDDTGNIIDQKEYEIFYSNNTNAGIATVTIKDVEGGNYVLSGASKTFEITKAAAPTDIQTGTLNIINGTCQTYTYDFNNILPGLSEGKYGTISYGQADISLVSQSEYNYGASTAVSDRGVLTLAQFSAEDGKMTGRIGTVKVTVTTTNYENFQLKLVLNAVDQIKPEPDGTIIASEITYGQTLSESRISGTMKDPDTGKSVNGMFAWTDGTINPNAGGYEAEWTFTPAAGYEKYATATGTVTIKVNKATPTFTAPTAQENLTYTGQEQALITAGSDGPWHHAVQPDRERHIQPGHPCRHRCRNVYRVVSGDWRCKPQRYRTRQRGGQHWEEAADDHRGNGCVQAL